jgi:hypothetical protein
MKPEILLDATGTLRPERSDPRQSCALENAFAILRADAASPAREGQHGKANGADAGTACASTQQ